MADLKTKLKFIWELITEPGSRFYYNSVHGKYHDMDDETYLKKMYKARLGKELDLENPKGWSEKLQWIKLYDRRPEYNKMVDKYEAKKLAASIIGEEYVLPALGIWERAEDIDISALPDQFVLKCTHDSGGFVICTDKSTFDLDAAKAKLGERMKKNFYWGDREWVYKDVQPRILAEEYIPELRTPENLEYKLVCFNGKVCFIAVCKGPAHSSRTARTNDFYYPDLTWLDFYSYYQNSGEKLTEKPKFWDEVIEMSEKLSAGIPQIRCDFFVHDDKIYFGELTFFTGGGFVMYNHDEWDEIIGSQLVLPEKRQ